jgi:hypothetical protein
MAGNKEPGAIEAIAGAAKPVQAAAMQPQGQIQVPTGAGEPQVPTGAGEAQPQEEAPTAQQPEQNRMTDDELLDLSPKAQEALLATPETKEGDAAGAGGEADKAANLSPQQRSLLQKVLEDQKADEARATENGEQIAGEEGNATGAQQAGAADAAGDKKTVEEVKVSWQPLMQVGQVVDAGQPFGHFQISREKKEVDDKEGKGQGQGAAPAQGAHGAHGAHGAQGKKEGENAPAGAVKGADGKTPVMLNNQQNPDEQKKPSKGVEADEGGKLYVIDQVSGERMEIPENGDLQTTHAMKIKSIGTVGELKDGDELFSYENATAQEIEDSKKAQQKGVTPEELQKTKDEEKGPGIDVTQKARAGVNAQDQ